MLAELIVRYCSPTLAGIKAANMFNCPFPTDGTIGGQLRSCRDCLTDRGIHIAVLRKGACCALLYVYRHACIARILQDEETFSFLRQYGGYRSRDVKGAIRHVSRRLREFQDFPHEIGVFLDYPLRDVLGFIENGGQGCLCCGCWKAYSDEESARKAFQRIKKCEDIYRRLYARGRTLRQLAVPHEKTRRGVQDEQGGSGLLERNGKHGADGPWCPRRSKAGGSRSGTLPCR